jgi:hypothetical protein
MTLLSVRGERRLRPWRGHAPLLKSAEPRHVHSRKEPFYPETLADNIHIKEEVKGPRYCPSIESKVRVTFF